MPGAAPRSDYDFIVVGSGAGGGPVACNLAAAGFRVLLLEAGSAASGNQNSQVPAFHPQASEDPELSWGYYVHHYDDPAREQRDRKYDGAKGGIFYPRGAALGGSTAVNAMVTVYPHARDWDAIAALTHDQSWSSTAMRPYFQRLERCAYLSGEQLHGHGKAGWLATTLPPPQLLTRDKWALASVAAAAAQFIRDFDPTAFLRTVQAEVAILLKILSADLNADSAERDSAEGVWSIPMAVDDRQRCGVREHIVATQARFPDRLHVVTDALVTRILFQDDDTSVPDPVNTADAADGTNTAHRREIDEPLVATGVAYTIGKNLYRAHATPAPDQPASGAYPRCTASARYEVILAAGAFNTPQLLKLSGIGPARELAGLQIPCRIDAPGVGANLQDRLRDQCRD